MQNYFFCYNKKVSDYLKEKGVKYITVALDPKSKKMFSLYLVTEELNQLLRQYSSVNKTK